jgi:formamidase
MRAIRIDRTKRLCDEPNCGHNRYHPDIAPLAEVEQGEEIALETRDGVDGQIPPGATEADLATLDTGSVHPLTGPVFVKGAMPGDILEISPSPQGSPPSSQGSASCVT